MSGTLRRGPASALALAALLGAAGARPGHAQEPEPERSLAARVLAYLPNRLLDTLDVVRLRVRVGPGRALSLRATEGADLFLGTYAAVHAGLPGPRGRTLPRLPVGIESRTGVEVSLPDVSTGAGFAPDYSATEFGFGVQALLLGFDAGIDPVELVDLLVGLGGVDLREDDL